MSENEEIFEGQRIYLRRLRETDIDDRYLSWFDNEKLMEYYTTTKHTFTKEKIVEELNQAETTHTYLYGIFTKETDVCIGNVKIGPIKLAHMTSDLVVLIEPDELEDFNLKDVEQIVIFDRAKFGSMMGDGG